VALINNIVATTELEAVNSMLAAVGTAPITDLVAGQSLLDVEMATARLKAAAREVQSAPWQFNRRPKYPVSSAAVTSWTDPDGTDTDIYIFLPPTGLAGFDNMAQPYSYNVPDVVIAPSLEYAPVGTQVFFDRANHRDGLPTSEYPDQKFFINAWFFLDFDKLPETARRYITVLAARRFIAATIGSQELEGFSLKDEAQALRLLKRDQGDDTNPNMLNHPDVNRVLGGRVRNWRGW
jgi:hypothetical protein